MRLEKAKSVLNGNVAKVYVINNEGIEVGEGATVLSSVEDLVFKLKEK